MRRLVLATVAAAGVFALTGCSVDLGSPAASPTSAPASSAKTAPSASGSKKAAGLPDVCGLLSRDQVASLTGKKITQIDPDGEPAGATVRHCQWQLSGGRLAIQLSPTTVEDFKVRAPSAKAYPGVGDDAYTDSGHLFVRTGKTVVDVYFTGAANAAADTRTAATIAKVVLDRL